MKTLIKTVLLMILVLSLCSCSAIQATLAENIEAAYGVEGKTYDEHKEYYQAEWDALFYSISDLWNMVVDKYKENDSDYIENLNTDVNEENNNSISENDLIDWATITEDNKLTLANIKNENGYTDHYNNGFTKGQCTWYAYGRFCEDNGFEKLDVNGNAKKWLDNCKDENVYVERDVTNIVPNSIAVDYKTSDLSHPGHVTYIEHVTYDENGDPVDVYFTEANWDSNGAYNEGTDAIVKKLPYSEFIDRGTHKVLGYIIPKN